MKIKIGPYLSWIGPYQIAEKILFWKDKYNDDTVDNFGRWLAGESKMDENTFVIEKPSLLLRLCQWIESKRQRTVKIQIDPYDTWDMHSTLSLIIVPMLKQLNKTKHGCPFTDDEDVPEHLRSTAAPPKKDEWDIDTNHDLRWEWIMGEMIWAFEQDTIDWEEKFYSGNIDTKFVKNEGTDYSTMVDGPNHTFKIDFEGMDKHRERMVNGRRLFAKYYEALWD